MKNCKSLNAKLLCIFFLFIGIRVNAQITSGDLVNIHDVDNTAVSGLTGMDTCSLFYNKTLSALQVYNGTVSINPRQEPKDGNPNKSDAFQKTFYVNVTVAGAKSVLLQYYKTNTGATGRIWDAFI